MVVHKIIYFRTDVEEEHGVSQPMPSSNREQVSGGVPDLLGLVETLQQTLLTR